MTRVSVLPVLPVLLGFLASAAAAAPPTPVAASMPAAASGRAVYERWCAPCHAPGAGHPGTQSLQVKYAGKVPAVLLERTDLAPRTVAQLVRQGVLSMAPFRKTEITDAELAALAAYVSRNYGHR